MEMVIEESNVDLSKLAAFLRRDSISEPLRIANVRIEQRWIQVGGDYMRRTEEFKHVIVADIQADDDYAIFTLSSVLTEAFEGTGTIFSIPDSELRWMVP